MESHQTAADAQCAALLEERYREDYEEVVWFLITDSTALRHWVRVLPDRQSAGRMSISLLLAAEASLHVMHSGMSLCKVNCAHLQAREAFGVKLLTMTHTRVEHSSRYGHPWPHQPSLLVDMLSTFSQSQLCHIPEAALWVQPEGPHAASQGPQLQPL